MSRVLSAASRPERSRCPARAKLSNLAVPQSPCAGGAFCLESEPMTVYAIVLFLHSLLRWVVLLSGVFVVGRALSGNLGGKPYEKGDRVGGVVFVSALHLNFILGLLLYLVLSPVTAAAFADMGAAMKTSALRFFVVEHPFGTILAVVLATVGSARIKRAAEDAAKHKRALIFHGIALFALLISIPWPFYSAGRSLLFLG